MEMLRILIFAATLFAIAYSTGIYSSSNNLRKNTKSEFAAIVIGLCTLAIFMATGAFMAEALSAATVKAGCLLFFCVSAIRKLLEMKMADKNTTHSFADAVFLKSSDAAVAGFGAGLGGINIPIAITICVLFHILVISSLLKTKSEHSYSSMPALGAILFISLAVLL